MIFRPYQKLLSYLPIFKVYDPILNKSQILEMKNFVKYLGILIDFDLSLEKSHWSHLPKNQQDIRHFS